MEEVESVELDVVVVLSGGSFSDRRYALSELVADAGDVCSARSISASWRTRQAEERLLLGPAYDDRGLVFCHPDGRPYHPDRFSRELDRRTARNAVPRMLRGLLFCGHPGCGKRMEGSWNHGRAHYRCQVGKAQAAATGTSHPLTVYVREDVLASALDQWIGQLFDPANLDATVAALADAGPLDEYAEARADAARRTIEDCDLKLDRHRAALEAGADATIVASWMAEVRRERLNAQRMLAAASPQPTMTAADVRQLIDELVT